MCECLDDVSLPPEASVHLQVDYGKLVYTYKLLRYTKKIVKKLSDS